MRRWLLIPLMAPVMCLLFWLAIWADRLYRWQYNTDFTPPTEADYIRAAIVFWGALLTPILIGLVGAIVAFHRQSQARWPVLESFLVAFTYLTFVLVDFPYLSMDVREVIWVRLTAFLACPFAGGAAATSLLNMGACVRQRMWGKSIVAAVVVFAGMLYLFWLFAFIIYIDT